MLVRGESLDGPATPGEELMRRSPRLEGANGVGGDGRKGRAGEDPACKAVNGWFRSPVLVKGEVIVGNAIERELVGDGGMPGRLGIVGSEGSVGLELGEPCRGDGLYMDGELDISVDDLKALTVADGRRMASAPCAEDIS